MSGDLPWFKYFKGPSQFRVAPASRKGWAVMIALFVLPAWGAVAVLALASVVLKSPPNPLLVFAPMPIGWLAMWRLLRSHGQQMATAQEVPAQWGRQWGVLFLMVVPLYGYMTFSNYAPDESGRWFALGLSAAVGLTATLVAFSRLLASRQAPSEN